MNQNTNHYRQRICKIFSAALLWPGGKLRTSGNKTGSAREPGPWDLTALLPTLCLAWFGYLARIQTITTQALGVRGDVSHKGRDMDRLRKAKNRISGSWGSFAASSTGAEKRPSCTPSTMSVKHAEDVTGSFDHATGTAARGEPVTVNGNANGAVKALPTTSIVELAKIITKETEKLEKYLRESRSPMPSFDVDGPANFPNLPDDIKAAREEVLRATKDLQCLVTGPTESVRWMSWDVSLLL